jgi:hypothetical protein
MKLNKVAKEKIAQQLRDLGDDDSNDNDEWHDNDWQQGGEESDVVAFLVVGKKRFNILNIRI